MVVPQQTALAICESALKFGDQRSTRLNALKKVIAVLTAAVDKVRLRVECVKGL